jgi:hypothetical protein
MDTPVLFLILEEMLSAFAIQCNVGYQSFVYHLYYVAVWAFCFSSFYRDVLLNFVQGFCCI